MRARPGLEFAPVADRAILYAPEADQVLVLQSLASRAWVLAGEGRSSAEIADDLCISLSTVKTHLASLMNKLGARNRVELAMWAYETDHRGRFVEVMGAASALAALNIAATALGLSDAYATTSGGYAAASE